MRAVRNPPGLGSESGTTFIETIAAVALFSLAAGALSTNASEALRSYARVRLLSEFDRRLVLVEHVLRRSVARIRVPAQAASLRVEHLPSGLRLYWLDGDPERFLDVFASNGRVVVSDGLSSESVAGFQYISVTEDSAEAKDETQPAVPVVRVEVGRRGGEHVTIRAAVATWPLCPAPLRPVPLRPAGEGRSGGRYDDSLGIRAPSLRFGPRCCDLSASLRFEMGAEAPAGESRRGRRNV